MGVLQIIYEANTTVGPQWYARARGILSLIFGADIN
jgi:hypothetical protein